MLAPNEDALLAGLPSAPALAAGAPPGIIGPNAIIRMAEALTKLRGPEVCRAVFTDAGVAHYLATPPADMVDEREVARLQRALFDRMGEKEAGVLSREAGRLTGEYLLANRIPKLAQRALRLMPRRLAAQALVKAIGRHAWTFAGSGVFSHEFTTNGLVLRIGASPLCRLLKTAEPACHYYAGTFERVFGSMLGSATRAVEFECLASGGRTCAFLVTW